jgi:4-amino-4-deoxy-L-arabinose transferase-like glycosyltransferase
LTVLFYPPLFYFVLAAVYSVLGVSEASALVAEFGFLLLLAWGAFRLSRHWLDPLPSFAASLLLIGAPQLAFWGQQIMLDVPAYACIVWAAEFFVRYLHTPAKKALYAAVVCTVAAIYTKYNAVFFAVVLAVTILYLQGWRAFRDGTVLRAGTLGLGLLLPIIVVFFAFAGYDIEQAASMPGSPARWSIEGLTYYARIMPSVLSWPTFALACLYVLLSVRMPTLRLARADAVFLSTWVIAGYAFYSMIAVKEPRHILFITYPFTVAAILVLDRLLVKFKSRFAVIVILAGGVLIQTLATCTVPFVTGMRQAAEFVARVAPPDTNVGFWGARRNFRLCDARLHRAPRPRGCPH